MITDAVLKDMLSIIWDRIGAIIDDYCISGKETCTHASYAVARGLAKMGLAPMIIGGEFDGQDHYWVEVMAAGKTYLIDFGNNILSATENKPVRPLVIQGKGKWYKRYGGRNEAYSLLGFLRTMKSQGTRINII